MPQGDLLFLTSGAPIAVAATATPGTLLYTCIAGSSQIDAVRIVASNTDESLTVTLTIQFAGTSANNALCWQIPPKSTFELPILRGNGAAAIRAFASTASAINCYIDANRYTL
jgi:hypothetical protein